MASTFLNKHSGISVPYGTKLRFNFVNTTAWQQTKTHLYLHFYSLSSVPSFSNKSHTMHTLPKTHMGLFRAQPQSTQSKYKANLCYIMPTEFQLSMLLHWPTDHIWVVLSIIAVFGTKWVHSTQLYKPYAVSTGDSRLCWSSSRTNGCNNNAV